MTYDLIQSALITAIEVVAIAGFGSIVLHALYKSHKNWMQVYCPPCAPQPVEEVPIPTSEPKLTEIPAAAPPPEPQPENLEIDLNALDSTSLRKLCTKYQIAWAHVRGKNRHATKAAMIFQLQAKLSA